MYFIKCVRRGWLRQLEYYPIVTEVNPLWRVWWYMPGCYWLNKWEYGLVSWIRKYFLINTTDTETNGFYVIMFTSEEYTLQDNTTIDGQIITSGKLVVKATTLPLTQLIQEKMVFMLSCSNHKHIHFRTTQQLMDKLSLMENCLLKHNIFVLCK